MHWLGGRRVPAPELARHDGPWLETTRCPLCLSADLAALPGVSGRAYAECADCGLAFLRRADLPSVERARAEYALHCNQIDDANYRAFLDRLAAPLCDRLTAGARGLDYGCGPGPALVAMLGERGFDCRGYDPLFADHSELLHQHYDFITCTEVAEHFAEPRAEFEGLRGMLKPGGWLAVMTQWRRDQHDFARWRYVHDPTHVAFYRERSLRWVADWLGLAFDSPGPNLALMRAPVG